MLLWQLATIYAKMDQIPLLNEIAQFGLAGVLIYVIIKPMMTWFMKRADENHTYITQLIDTHFARDREQHDALMKAIHNVPAEISESIKHTYPPEEYGKKLHAKSGNRKANY